MPRQSSDAWEVVLCLNCDEKILVTRPHMPPSRIFPEKRIHRAYKPYPPYLTVFCTKCGHYTLLSPLEHGGRE